MAPPRKRPAPARSVIAPAAPVLSVSVPSTPSSTSTTANRQLQLQLVPVGLQSTDPNSKSNQPTSNSNIRSSLSHYSTSAPIETKQIIWDVKDFQTLCDLKDGLNKITLDFEAGSSIDMTSKWRFRFTRKEGKDDIGAFLGLIEHTGPEKELFGKCNVIIKATNGGVFKELSTNSITDFKSIKERGWTDMTTLSKIISPTEGALVNGTLTIYLKLDLFSGPRLENLTASATVLNQCQRSLSEDLGTLLDTGTESDVTFVTRGGQKIKAHKGILAARSPVFTSMFGTNMIESATGEVTVEDISCQALKIVLRYIYTGTIEGTLLEPSIFKEIIYAADEYSISSLKEYCDQIFATKKCTEGTAMELLRLAKTHNLPTATSMITDFIKGNVEGVLSHDTF